MLSRPLKFGRNGTGTAFIYEGSVLQTINAANQYHGAVGFSQGTVVEGISFLASATGSITNTENNGGILRCTSAGHGLSSGQYLALNGMGDALHVGITGVSVIDLNTFDCDDIAYNSVADTGFWQRGSSLKVEPGYTGRFSLDFSCSFFSAGNNKDYKVELAKNASELNEIVVERMISVLNDLGSFSAAGLVELQDGDVIWMMIGNTTDSTDMSIVHSNMHLE